MDALSRDNMSLLFTRAPQARASLTKIPETIITLTASGSAILTGQRRPVVSCSRTLFSRSSTIDHENICTEQAFEDTSPFVIHRGRPHSQLVKKHCIYFGISLQDSLAASTVKKNATWQLSDTLRFHWGWVTLDYVKRLGWNKWLKVLESKLAKRSQARKCLAFNHPSYIKALKGMWSKHSDTFDAAINVMGCILSLAS